VLETGCSMDEASKSAGIRPVSERQMVTTRRAFAGLPSIGRNVTGDRICLHGPSALLRKEARGELRR
jgi:hypothetical protein